MKQIKILLSSVLTLLLITGNNASAAAFIKYDGIQAQQPNMNSGGRFMPKRNRLGDDISGYGYKNILKKGNVFKGDVIMLPNRNSGGRLHNNGAFLPWHRGVNKLHGNSSGDPLPVRVGKEKNALIPNPTVTLKGMVQMPQESQIGETGKNRAHMDLENEEVFPKVELGPDVVTTFDQKTNQVWTNGNATSVNQQGHIAAAETVGEALEHGPGIANQPKGVPLKFINGEWR